MPKYLLFFLLLLHAPCITYAGISVEGTGNFKSKINKALSDAKNSSTYLRKLVNKTKASPSIITIRAITDDRSTWHTSGKKSRSHTEAADTLARGAQRDTATDSIIYINKNRVTASHKSYKSGTFIHELVHALDLSSGNYNGDYKLREKRAVFFQNIWRKSFGKSLRKDYHDRFKTLEYQKFSADRKLGEFVDYYFEHNDVP